MKRTKLVLSILFILMATIMLTIANPSDKIAKEVYVSATEEKEPVKTETKKEIKEEKKINDQIKIGDVVVPIKLIDYKGTYLVKYDKFYEVTGIDKRGCILSAIRGKKRPIWSVLKKTNLKKIK